MENNHGIPKEDNLQIVDVYGYSISFHIYLYLLESRFTNKAWNESYYVPL